MTPVTLGEWGVVCIPLKFRFDGESTEYSDNDIESKTFYDKMRAGGVAKTSAINTETFKSEFEKVIKEGNDVLYIGLSSGLSATYNSARLAAMELNEKYPDRKIVTVDSLSVSAAIGLIIFLILKEKKDADVEEAARYAESLVPRLCHWATVEDLVYLTRGGRLRAAAAFAGTALGLKPVLHVDNDGHLVSAAKVRGRRTAISAIVEKYGELAEDAENGTVYISHADCMKDAEELSALIKEKYNAKVDVIANIGSVIGAHAGPGTIALFFVGKER